MNNHFRPKEEEESQETVPVDRVLNKFTMCKSLNYIHKNKQLNFGKRQPKHITMACLGKRIHSNDSWKDYPTN